MRCSSNRQRAKEEGTWERAKEHGKRQVASSFAGSQGRCEEVLGLIILFALFFPCKNAMGN